MKGIFLSVEGIEGVGKTTAIKFIQDYLIEAKQDFILTREPGGTPVAEQIREVLLAPNSEETMVPVTELLLMFAARAQLANTVIKPALAQFKWVVSDRFVDATYAYQGGGRQLNIGDINVLEKMTIGSLTPSKTILLDAPPEIGLQRAKQRGAQDRIEQERIEFFERVRSAYLIRAENDKQRFCIIDATQSIMQVHSQLKIILDELIKQRGA